MKSNAGPSVQLAQKNGVKPTWKDKEGRVHRTPEEAIAKISAALAPGVTDSADGSGRSDVPAGLNRFETEDKHITLYAPHVAVLKRSLEKELARLEIDIQFESKAEIVLLHWSLLTEYGETYSGTTNSADPQDTKLRIHLPETTGVGYHRLTIALSTQSEPKVVKLQTSFPVIITPDKCFMPATFNTGTRFWGPVVHLTGFASKRNWGVGDFTDLKSIVAFCAAQGGGVVGVSPLHGQDPTGSALFNRSLPSHRSFFNVLYIDVEATDDFQESENTRRMVHSPEFQDRLSALKAGDVADLKQIAQEKLQILDRLYQQFRSHHLNKMSARARTFRAYQQSRGKALRYFATHQALAERFAKEGNHFETWRAWPDKYRDPESEAVKEFAASNNERIEFFEYLQWQAESQLEAVGNVCLNSRLPVGLLTEVSPLVSPHGAEGWQHQNCLADSVYLAEAPRQYLSDGYVTESPPFKIAEMRKLAYAPLAQMLEVNMRYAGAVKIAHAHHWLTPLISADPQDVNALAQVEHPVEEILGIIALESHRNSTMIVLDADQLLEFDSRTVTASQLDKLLSNWNIFPRHDLLASDAETMAKLVKSETTERRLLELAPADLSPLAAFWHGTDLSARVETLPSDEKEKRNQLIDRRVSHRVEVLRLLDEKSLLPEGATTDPSSVPVMTPPMVSAVISLLSKSSAALVLFRIEDLGTADRPLIVYEDPAYPNWKVKMTPLFEELIESESTTLVMDEFQSERGCFFDQIDVSYTAEDSANRQVTIPTSTYRLQMHKGFAIPDAHKLVDYLEKLGISHYYLSPLWQSRPGSMHGYDVISHSNLNPELGTQEQLVAMSEDLSSRKMGIIVDLVPNHMGIGKHNPWWIDVLEHGPASEYGEYFDIDWSPVKDELHGKVLLPVLGEPYGKVLTSGQLKISFNSETGKFTINYYENEFPLNPKSYSAILSRRLDVLNDRLGNKDMAVMRYMSIVDAFSSLPDGMSLTQDEKARRLREMKVSTIRLAELCGNNPHILEFIEQNIKDFDCTEDDRVACRRLHELLEQQAYRLAFWRVAAHEINYRRFFDINDLAGVRVEDQRAFTDMHAFVFKLIKDGIVQGLRIDHPDGLFDPAGYFMRLQEEAFLRLNPEGENFLPGQKQFQRQEEFPIYLLGEKILAPFERMEEDWVIHGTTGYDFLNAANGVLLDEKNARVFSDFYAMVSNETDSYRELAYNCKHLIMQTSLASELNVLAHHLSQIAESNWMYRDFTLNSLRHALSEVVAFFPVYRTYVKEGIVSNVARDYVMRAVRLAKRNNRTVHPGIFDFIHYVLTLRLSDDMDGYPGQEQFQKDVLNFAMKFQQFTGPVMAKSLEDTLFYKYNRFVALNEVGGEPNHFGHSIADFHSHNEARQKTYPYSMLATSTHDTKRSEDVRARLTVLSEIPDNWQERVLRWMDYNSGRYTYNLDKRIPSSNDEYLLYQTLVGTYPLTVDKPEELSDFANRIEAYMLKAAREAKDHTSWINQDATYEEGMKSFIHALLKPSNANGGSDPFFIDFLEFHQHVSRMGLIKSLSQTLFKLTCPGVPDFYQGNEMFDFSLVDPDNRRPVDFALRDEYLTKLLPFVDPDSKKTEVEFQALIKDMLKNFKDGRLKLFVTAAILQQRKLNPRLFTVGKYIPIGISGQGSDHFIAYLRQFKDKSLIVVAPVLVTKLISPDQRSLYSGPEDTQLWQTTKLNLPKEFQRRKYTDIFTGQSMEFGERRPRITQILERFPVAVLTS
jgi:(1->4)-alpha-D-glucan 1-alpha-D-glucosylmutase